MNAQTAVENRLISPVIAFNAALGTSVSFPPMLRPRSVKTRRVRTVTGQANVKTEQWARVSDEALLDALRHPSTRIYGRKQKPMAPWLYAAADAWDSKKADFNRWFVTGPQDRLGYIKGPFPLAQVERVAASARLAVVCFEEERPIAYRLDEHLDEKRERLRAQLRHLTLPSQRGYRRKIERELASFGVMGIDA